MRSLLTLVLLLACAPALATPDPSRLRLDVFASDDNDGSVQQSTVLNLETRLPEHGKDAHLTFGGGNRVFRADAGTESFKLARAELQTRPAPETRLTLRGQHLRSDDWTLLLPGLTLTQRLSARWYLEASADRDIVDTVTAIRNRTQLDSYAASVDYRLGRDWTVVAGVSSQDLSDGNDRLGRVVRLVYAREGADWNLQTRLRRIDSDFRGVGYFSPRRLEDAVLLGKISQPLLGDRFLVSLQAGGGVQRVDGQDSEALYLGELRGRGWFNDHYGVEARTMCSNTGDLNAGPAGGGYYYCEGLLSLIGAW